jgi:isopenicillin-N epimerase
MASMPLPPCDPVELQRRLWDEARIEVPVIESPHGPLIRVSIQAYNTPADGEALLTALAARLAQVPA